MGVDNKIKPQNNSYFADYFWLTKSKNTSPCSNMFIISAEQCMSCPEFRWCKSGQDRCFKPSNLTGREC